MPVIDRRSLIAVGAALGLAPAARAVPQEVPADFVRMPLWPGKPPGSDGVTAQEQESLRTPNSPKDDTAFVHVTRPTLTMLRAPKPNGAALLLIPGGGYRRVAIGHEGYEIARRFAAAGYHCYILAYRLPADGWTAGPDAPLQDAQRALRIVRSRAAADGFDPVKIGMIGFSAGGHLAARLASTSDKPVYLAKDAIDALPLSAMVAGLLYPVVLLDGPNIHTGSRNEMLGTAPAPDRARAYSADNRIAPGTPPSFLAHALDDRSVPPENSLAMLAALRNAKVPSEMHLFETGGHGFGLALPDGTPSPWPELFMTFARRHGMP
ncbi:alpha/beta hydrolase [Sphingomonas sp. JC676]|uniref:alpha/beta hydrolase n=1 Tax=Sphingomonas sp. JC676 TaxID=2768065 RepID=UPI0016586D97|nr:alpha/beta hydrolase [Sphingomonas sp. JC676]MBC9031890.1 alpha/beta hydrolase [Sphingomonas sp. JC676]